MGSRTAIDVRTVRLLGGHPVPDFCNTVEHRLGRGPIELLRTYADLVAWAVRQSLITPHEGDLLLERAAQRPAEAERALAGAIALREAVYRILVIRIHGEASSDADIEVLNEAVAGAVEHRRISPMGRAFHWTWSPGPDLAQPVWASALAIAELMTSPDLRRVKRCPGTGDCGWLFLDTSRNGTRRWCSMEGCGSRAKMRRLRARLH